MKIIPVIDYASALYHLVAFSYKIITKSILFATSAGSQYRYARFGLAGNFLYFTRLVDTDALEEMHWNINLWIDSEVLAWRESYLATCNAVSVAGAIFASIGLTALQLPDMYTVHWSARALCIVSMILGVLSVTLATSQQHTLAALKNAISIRLWLSRGRLKAPELAILSAQTSLPMMLVELPQILNRKASQAKQRRPDGLPNDWREEDRYKDFESLKGLPLESSISMLKAVAMPRHLLSMAVLVFVVGFGLYLLFQWVENMGDQPIANRNVIIVFIVSVGAFVVYYSYIVSTMVDNQAKKTEEFDLNSVGGSHKPAALDQLEKDLEEVQKRMKSLEEQRNDLESRIQSSMRTSYETGRSHDDAPDPI